MFNWGFVSSLPKKWKKHSYLQSKICQIFWSFWTFYKFKLHPNFVYALHANFLKGPYESGLFVVCSIQLAASNWKNAGDRIQTTNLWCQKRSLCQLSQSLLSSIQYLFIRFSTRTWHTGILVHLQLTNPRFECVDFFVRRKKSNLLHLLIWHYYNCSLFPFKQWSNKEKGTA